MSAAVDWLAAYPKRPGAPLILPGATLAEALGRRRRKPPTLDPALAVLLPLLAANLTQAEIGRRLFLSPAAVKHRARRLYTALGATNRVGAVTAAIGYGLLPEHGGAR